MVRKFTEDGVRLEHDSGRQNRKRGFPQGGFCDSRCWLGWGPASHGKTLFTGPSGSGGWFGSGGADMPGDGGVVRGERGQRGEVVAALADDRQRGGEADGRLEAAHVVARAGMAVGADRREAGPDVARGGGRAQRARHAGELRRGVALFQARGDQLQKKACSPASRTAPTSPAGAAGGGSIRAGLIRAVWCSSTRPGPRPT